MQSKNRQPGSISRDQARQVDERAVSQLGMTGLVLMENAGRGLADQFFALRLPGPVLVCCGVGNNGGDGFVMARHLDLRGVAVQVFVWGDANRFSADALTNFTILKRCQVPIEFCGLDVCADQLSTALKSAGCVVDALLGTGARGQPRAPLNAVIDLINGQPIPKLAVDVPSGLDCDTGQPALSTIRADHTCTFVATKTGFAATSSRPYLGSVHVLDIGVPRTLIESIMAESP